MTRTRLIALSERIYRALLVLYPPAYQQKYGQFMVQHFRDVSRDAYRRHGLRGLVFWWVAVLFDLAQTVIEQRRKIAMSRATLAELTGMLLIVGGACAAIASLSQLVPEHTLWNGFDLELAALFIIPAYLLIGIANFGLASRYGEAAGALGRAALVVSGVGALTIAFPFGFQLIIWNIHYVGLAIHACGAILLGLIQLRTRALPVSGGLLLLIGLLPLVMISAFSVRRSKTTRT
jgi:hypothetical protein